MDLASLMNDGGEEAGSSKKSVPSEAKRSSQPLAISPITNGHQIQQYAQTQAHPQAPPLSYPAPPSLVAARSSGSHGLTQLHTQAQAVPYFPATPGQPSASSDYRYRSQDAFSTTTPGRPPSHGAQYPFQPSPSGRSVPPPLQQPNSTSPTPSSHQGQHTPHSVRQSPLAVMAHPPHQPPSAGGYPQYQHSQPSTPLGPPPLHSQRSAGTYNDLTSPFHQRTFSGASNGITSHSPAAIGNLVESPNAFQRPSPTAYQRHSSQFLSQTSDRDRERSLSVSPKTMVTPRPPSLGSRQSSLQDQVARSSSQSSVQQQQQTFVQPSAPYSTIPQNHVTPPQYQQSGPVAQTQPLPLPNLLNATSEVAPNVHTPSPIQKLQSNSQAHSQSTEVMATATEIPAPPKQLKRPAPEPAQEPPAKRKMARKYTTRPPWAVLSRHNPRYQQAGGQPNGRTASPPQQQPHQLTNGASAGSGLQPWQREVPLDDDLVRVRSIMGKWEKTFRWNTPYPDMLKAVQDWLYVQLSELQDVGMDPMEGTIEIEARIGVLKIADTDDRCRLPIRNSVVIDPTANSRYHFKSRMTVGEHAAMNDFLNTAFLKSRDPGRIEIKYTHPHEIDYFHTLAAIGLDALPQSLQRRSERQRPPRLRVTRAWDPRTRQAGHVIGRIVKIHLSDLHIFNPQWNYDTRISIALEVNLDRPNIDPDSLISSPASDGKSESAAPPRIKDRVSYKHLAYSIDLTKVDSPGASDSSFELEVEVDSKVLREQMGNLSAGRASAFGDVVSGFLDNITYLTRQGPVS